METELRFAGERQVAGLTGRHRGGFPESGLADLASAAVALGEISLDAAQAIVDDYALALSHRGHGVPPSFRRMHRNAQQTAPSRAALTLPSIFHIDALENIGDDSTRVRTIAISAESCQISVEYAKTPSWHLGSRASRRGGRAIPGYPGMPGQMAVSDDHGTKTWAHFSGGGGDDGWEGHWTTSDPVSPLTAWLEIDGVRITLPETVTAAEVRVEDLEPGKLAHQYLWHRLAVLAYHSHEDDPVVEFLWRLGVIDPDVPEDAVMLEAFHRVKEAVQSGHQSLPKGNSGPVPELWRRFLNKRRHGRGPTGGVPLAALTPEFGGVQCALHGLRSDREGFSVEARLQGDNGPRHGMLDDQVGGTSPAWWAYDDRGNGYLGHWSEHNSGQGEFAGTITFGPALDPKATTLYVCPTGLLQRAVITVPLPTWSNR